MSESSDSADLNRRALDPSRSVVVEACAGSGKTWLLAARIVRLLLAGVAPGEILAITFTRKAAREIEERVVDWLQFLATQRDAQVADFLAERGVRADAATLRSARGLYERVLAAQPGLAVHTFHGWFLQLVAGAPLSANLAGAALVDTGARLFDELWLSFAATLARTPEGAATQGLVRLLGEAGLAATRRLIWRAFNRRSEWLACGAGGAEPAELIMTGLRRLLGVGAAGSALADFFCADWKIDFEAYLGFLESSELATDQQAALSLRGALVQSDRACCFAALRGLLLTRDNTLRSKKAGAALSKRYTAAGAERFLALHEKLGACLLACVEAQTAERIVALNQDAGAVFAAFLAHVEAFKKARRQIDFVDAEWNVLKLLRDEETAAFLQARLDARYQHVLLDEFQDTNALQWQILLGWLAAYSDASRPAVFLVGDPKQAIYRFRRAEPRLFTVAAEFLVREFGAERCEQDATRRNAQAIVDVVNALFLAQPEFTPFRAQRALTGALPGRVELLPLCGKGEAIELSEPDGDESAPALRDPLHEAAREAEDLRLISEADCVAAKIAQIVGADGTAWEIADRGADGSVRPRAARYGDIMLLVRTRTHLRIYERALAAAGIPFDAGSRGGLLGALEVRDCVALLEFLVTPAADLKLAHALRSPIFACSDEELVQLAARRERTWWQRLQAAAAAGGSDAAAPLARAAALLGEWLPAADRLPAHDLLDRIYHQGEVIARYRLAVPAAATASVEANLRALLLLALDLDGGRYPSLPRFIDTLRDLREVEGDEAPDAGVIAAASVAAGRVRILTIHGAKGLEAPIVWLLGANAAPRPPDAWDVLVDWPPQAAAPQHFSFFGTSEDHGQARAPLFEVEAAAARREELNLLYVALTRARQVFLASGSDNAKDKGATPYRLLEAALHELGGGLTHGDTLPRIALTPADATAPASGVCPPLPPVGERRRLPDAGERFGILLHALLERRTGGFGAAGWWTQLGFSDDEYRRVLPVAERLLAAPGLQRFFAAASYRRAWNEIELAGSDGQLQRIDRLVEFNESAASELWVLDYKSSHSDSARLAAYQQQVRAYCQAAAAVFPRHAVRGAIIFADASLIEVC